MVSAEDAVSIVKSVAKAIGHEDLIIEVPKKKEENRGRFGRGLSNVQPIAQVSGRTHRDPNSVSKVSTKDHPRIVKLFKRGKSTKDVMEKYPSYRKMQLAAIKAWVTMGKY